MAKGKDVVIGLKDGVVTLKKGNEGEAPIVILIEPVDKQLDITIDELFNNKIH